MLRISRKTSTIVAVFSILVFVDLFRFWEQSNTSSDEGLQRTMPKDLRTLCRPLHLVLDWDGTLTKKDTLSLVGQIGYQAHSRSAKDSSSLPPWTDLVNGYMNDFTAHQSTYIPKSEARKTLQEEREWLSSLAPIENKSVRRVESSAIFKGVRDVDVQSTAKQAVESAELQLRIGWSNLLRKLVFPVALHESNGGRDERSQVSILSVNWSEHFIRCALRASAARQTFDTHDHLDSYIQTMSILANEIEGIHSPSGSDGSLSKKNSAGIRTSADKLANMPEHCRRRLDFLEKEAMAMTDVAASSTPSIIYVGDSATDLEPLLAADVGICIRDEPMGSSQLELAETFSRLGVRVWHVSESLSDGSGHMSVYWARDLQEIADVLPPVE